MSNSGPWSFTESEKRAACVDQDADVGRSSLQVRAWARRTGGGGADDDDADRKQQRKARRTNASESHGVNPFGVPAGSGPSGYILRTSRIKLIEQDKGGA